MQLERAREDLLVAGAGAATTVALAITATVGVVGISSLAMLAPVYVYLAYLFSRRGGPYGSWDVARNWALVTVLVGLGILMVAVL